ncbi:MAG: T9SS type A sorting domain-containing protein, partial [FCB group bacterium]|nr:T9SS type A sorting domain-containing protein [FCB group bacterium]
LKNSDNGSEVVTSDWAAAAVAGYPDYLYWSPNNIISGMLGAQFSGEYGLTSLDVDPQLTSLDGRETGGIIDPRPATNGPAYDNVDTVPADDFFTQTDFKGAFGDDLWMAPYSWLTEKGRMSTVSVDGTIVFQAPESSRLLGNYPNPFNPTTNIRFDLATSGEVTVSVYDVQGRLVSDMSMGQMDRGIQQITWNAGQDLTSTGLYIYKIHTPQSTLTGKMMLLK